MEKKKRIFIWFIIFCVISILMNPINILFALFFWVPPMVIWYKDKDNKYKLFWVLLLGWIYIIYAKCNAENL